MRHLLLVVRGSIVADLWGVSDNTRRTVSNTVNGLPESIARGNTNSSENTSS